MLNNQRFESNGPECNARTCAAKATRKEFDLSNTEDRVPNHRANREHLADIRIAKRFGVVVLDART
jgi:hypothetical protein